MRNNASIVIALLVLTNIAFGAVGDVGVSDGSKTVQPGISYAAGMASGSVVPSTGFQISSYQSPGYPSQGGTSGGSAQTSSYQANLGSNYGSKDGSSGSNPPQTAGPYQERLSADDLKFNQPQAESFQPDSNLNFITASPPGGVYMEAYEPGQGQGNWYYPGSVNSRNLFYVQTSSGLKTTAGCSFGGYLPLWSDINSAGNFYVYEWYPGQWTPSVRWWGWTWQGFKKGWFTGDVSGWHILCYNCRDWSNYIYIYVWPNGGSSSVSGFSVASPVVTSGITQASLPSGAPTPPDPNSENLILPNFNLLQPSTGGSTQNPGQSSPVQNGAVPQTNVNYPTQAVYPLQGTNSFQSISFQSISPMQSSYPGGSSSGCTDCSDKTGYIGAYTGSYGAYAGPSGSAGMTYQAVYPKPTAYRWNQYYVQIYPGQISTVAGVRYGEWLPLLSKVGSSGIYWSYEWAQCGSPTGYYCYPEVKCFNYKSTGWYQTWFRGNLPGWHILSYYSNDWSNYVYIYVWPS
ncbi:MAG: hypothetical protein ACE14P_14190 [Methanotrichaceae archaeon]